MKKKQPDRYRSIFFAIDATGRSVEKRQILIGYSKIIYFVFFSLLFTQGNVFAEKKTPTRKVYVGSFQPYKSPSIPLVSEKIRSEFEKNFSHLGIEAEKLENYSSLEAALLSLKGLDTVFITGYYKKNKGENLNIYGQVYNPDTGFLIDALNVSFELTGMEDEKLPDDEMKENDNSVISKFVTKLSNRVKLNSKRKERTESINEFVNSSQIGKDINFQIRKEDIQESAEKVFKLFEDTEVVTATRTKTKLKDAPAAVYVISAEQIRERGYRTLEDALHDIPGMDFQHNYGIFPDLLHQRGLVGGQQRTLMYVDGIADNNLNENAMLAGSLRFPLNNVERIEVVSGPASALYGANAFNGIINVITKSGDSNPGHHIDATYGAWEKNFSNPGASASFSARGSTQGESPIHYSVGGYYYQTKGPNFGGIQNLDPPNNGSTSSNPNYNYHYDPIYALSKKLCGNAVCETNSNSIGYYWSPTYNNSQENTYNITAKFSKGGFRFETINWQYLQGEGTFSNGTQQIDTKQKGLETGKWDSRNLARAYGILSGALTTYDSKGKVVTYGEKGFIGSNWDFRNNSVLAGYLHKFSETLSLDSEAIVRHTEVLSSSHEEYPNTNGPGAYYHPGDTTAETNYSRPDYSYQAEERLQWSPSSKLSGIFGVVGKHFVVSKDYGSSERYTYTNYAMYYQQLYKPFDKLALTAGFRHDFITTYGHANTPRLSAVYTPSKNLTFKFLLGSAFREPSARELFSQTAQRKPNTSLRPEELRSAEAGASYRFLKKYFVSAQGFYNSVSNLILEVQTTDTTPIAGKTATGGLPWNQNQNIGRAAIYGAELETNITFSNSFIMFLNYTYNKGYYYDLPSGLSKSPSTAGRAGDDYANDLYLLGYKSVTNNSTVPAKGNIPNIAPHKANVGFTYYILKNLSVYLGINYIDVRRTIATNPEHSVLGYKMVKLNIRWDDAFKPGVFIQLHINNVTNEQFFDPGIRVATGAYYPTMHPLERRNIWFTVGYKF